MCANERLEYNIYSHCLDSTPVVSQSASQSVRRALRLMSVIADTAWSRQLEHIYPQWLRDMNLMLSRNASDALYRELHRQIQFKYFPTPTQQLVKGIFSIFVFPVAVILYWPTFRFQLPARCTQEELVHAITEERQKALSVAVNTWLKTIRSM